MKICPNCEHENSDNHLFCMKCGTQIAEKEQPKLTTLEPPAMAGEKLPALKRRNFLYFWLISLAFTPFIFVYYYFNFEDIRLLGRYESKKEVQYLDSNKGLVIFLIIVSVFIPFLQIIFRFMKFNKLQKYLKEHQMNDHQTMPFSGVSQIIMGILYYGVYYTGYVFFMIYMWENFYADFPLMPTTIVPDQNLWLGFGLMFAGFLLSIFYIVADFRWQKALNERILAIYPYAEEKMF